MTQPMTEAILRASAPRRRELRLAAALAPAAILLSWVLVAPSSTAVAVQTVVAGALLAGVLGTYAPVGGRPSLGCGRCAVMAGLSVPAGVAFLSAAREDPSMATLAVVVAGFGLAQRLRDPGTCPSTREP